MNFRCMRSAPDWNEQDARVMWADDAPTLGDWAQDRQYRAIVIEYRLCKSLLLLKNHARQSRIEA